MESPSFPRRIGFQLLAASLLAVTWTLLGLAPQPASANPECSTFANTPSLVAGEVTSNGGVTCTARGTGLFRVDVVLYQDGSEVGRAATTCHGEQQCGAQVDVADVDGGQQWCATAVAAYTGSGLEGSGGSPRTGMVCENQEF